MKKGTEEERAVAPKLQKAFFCASASTGRGSAAASPPSMTVRCERDLVCKG
jgi:hypothetical protein